MEKLIGVKELAILLGLQVSTIYSWVNQGLLTYIKVGRLVKFDMRDVEKWLLEKKVEQKNIDIDKYLK